MSMHHLRDVAADSVFTAVGQEVHFSSFFFFVGKGIKTARRVGLSREPRKIPLGGEGLPLKGGSSPLGLGGGLLPQDVRAGDEGGGGGGWDQ